MTAAAIAIALLGFAVGARFRLRTLILLATLLLFLSFALSLARGFNIGNTALTVIVAQFILQGSYFSGLVAQAALAKFYRRRRLML
jgi:lysylphosphatidylglycerol synthetase-like protein (DUF2156 family)